MSPTSAKKTTKFAGKEKIKKEEKPKFLETTFRKETPEKDKAITEEIIAFINTKSPQIPLDSYYYGTKDGDEELIASEYKGNFRVRVWADLYFQHF